MKILLIEPHDANESSLYSVIHDYLSIMDVLTDMSEAVAYARTGNYDVIVLNPVHDSEEYITLTTKLRKRKICTPLLFLCASSTLEAKVLALDNGADDAMSRPFEIEELYSRLRALARRHASYHEDSIDLGDVVFNRRQHLLEKDGQEIRLGIKEFSMFEMLALNRKQVVPKEKFVEKIWGYDSESEYNNVEVYISFLRKKLRELKSALKIVSVRGIGYYLEWDDDGTDEWYYL